MHVCVCMCVCVCVCVCVFINDSVFFAMYIPLNNKEMFLCCVCVCVCMHVCVCMCVYKQTRHVYMAPQQAIKILPM